MHFEHDPDQPRTVCDYDPHIDPALMSDSARARVEQVMENALASGDVETMSEAPAESRRMQAPYLNWAGKAERTSVEVDTVIKSQVSRLCSEIVERVNAFLTRPIEGDWPYVWLDAPYIKVRRGHRIVSAAVIVAVSVNTDGRRKVLGMTTGHSEAEPFWVEFLRRLARLGLRGVKLMISDAHEGLKAAITKVLSATWQRCRVHFMRNALSYACKKQKRVVSAWVGTAFAQDDAAAARKQWRDVADQMRPRLPKLAGLLDETETDVLAYMDFTAPHRTKIHSTNPLERLNGQIKRCADVVSIYPNEAAVVRLIGALMLEQNDEWATQRALYMILETIATMSNAELDRMPELAA